MIESSTCQAMNREIRDDKCVCGRAGEAIVDCPLPFGDDFKRYVEENWLFDLMPGFKRRPTYPKAVDDWTCAFEGKDIARVYREQQGSKQGSWRWCGLWSVPPEQSAAGGHEDTLDEALRAVKREMPR